MLTSFVVTAKQSEPSSASRFCRRVLGPCGVHAGKLVLASPTWTVIRRCGAVDALALSCCRIVCGYIARIWSDAYSPLLAETQPSRPLSRISAQSSLGIKYVAQHIALLVQAVLKRLRLHALFYASQLRPWSAPPRESLAVFQVSSMIRMLLKQMRAISAVPEPRNAAQSVLQHVKC